jgi:hypothetical protein
VLALNPAMPVTGVVHEGPRGGDGHLHLSRSGARPLRFEPADLILNPRRLKAKMQFQRDVTDPPQYGYTEAHCSAIADVCNKAAGASAEPDINADTDAIVGTFTARAQRIEGLTTYGTTVDRYRAMDALRPPPGERDYDRAHGPLRYLKDANTGDLVIRVSDLLSVARDHRGGSIEHGWLDARMQHLGWERARLRGYAEAGRAGRTGPMLRCDVYRGIEPCDMDAPDA